MESVSTEIPPESSGSGLLAGLLALVAGRNGQGGEGRFLPRLRAQWPLGRSYSVCSGPDVGGKTGGKWRAPADFDEGEEARLPPGRRL